MIKNRQNLIGLMLMAGIIFVNTLANAQCTLKVQLNVKPVSCKGDCNGSATVVDLDHTVPLYFFWSNGETTQSISGLCEGPISVTVWQGSQNCSFDLNSTIDGPYEIKLNCTSTVPTAPGTITTTVSGGTAPYGYVWNTNPVQYGSDATNLPEGSYMVIVTDANGCSAKTSCDIKGQQICGGRTQTMGGWGAPPHGNNPAAYMYANFAGAFPHGVRIGGCGNKIKLTSPQAVTDFLPSTTTPAVLPAGILVDPGQTYLNVLAGQAMALTLSIGFDNYDANFSSGNVPLSQQIINGGPFNGWTVSHLLRFANRRLGGCTTARSLSRLNDALTKVNENYDNGNGDNGYLSCSNSLRTPLEIVSGSFNYSVYPNPASGTVFMRFVSANDDKVTVDIYNIIGLKVAQLSDAYATADEEATLSFDISGLADGIYILNVQTSEKTYQQKMVVKK